MYVYRTVIGYAYGRAKEYVDNSGVTQGRKVKKIGYWGDIVTGPFISYGVSSRNRDLFIK